MEAARKNAFAAGVSTITTQDWRNRTMMKKDRYPQGIALTAPVYGSKMGTVLANVSAARDAAFRETPVRGPGGSPQNLKRANTYMTEMHRLTEASKGIGAPGMPGMGVPTGMPYAPRYGPATPAYAPSAYGSPSPGASPYVPKY